MSANSPFGQYVAIASIITSSNRITSVFTVLMTNEPPKRFRAT
jgi:hypothetical protein